MMRATAADRWTAVLLACALIVIYNANGREIASYDSQPNKFAARELLLRHTLTLNHVVGAATSLTARQAFVMDVDGNYRSAYSPVSPILAAAIAWPFWKLHVLDIRAPRAPAAIAALAASVLTAIAVALAFLTARHRLPRRSALLVAAGLGLGTGLWSTVSQTLWVHETAILGISLAMLAFARPVDRIGSRAALAVGFGLALAGVARPQLAPMIAVLATGLFFRARVRDAVAGTAIVALSAAALFVTYTRWFGHPFGPIALMETTNAVIHRTRGTFDLTLDGLLGLLVSPNRGLFIFSPITLLSLAGVRAAVIEGWRSPLRWCALAAIAQYLLYASYSVWWAGHTYGPRYLLDVLPVLVPLTAAVIARAAWRPVWKGAVALALAWSIVVAATGAFCYPADAWNTDPVDVDRDHARLWSWRDTQIVRCWERGASPQNFSLFDPSRFRATPAAGH